MSNATASAAVLEPGMILVVDDDAFNRDLLQQELDDLGHTSCIARDGAEALAVLEREPVDVVLLDIMMPRIDGFGVLTALRNREDLRDVPIIVVSALHDLENVVRGIEMGAVDYLPKPFEPALLKARIDTSLERRRWRLRERAYQTEIERQRRWADDLLRTLLPAEAIRELKEKGSVAPRTCPDVAVLFLDIVGFSEHSRIETPTTLVGGLTAFTEAAEQRAEALGLEKIKLVGDAVIVTGNLLRPHDDPVSACAACAYDLFGAMSELGPGADVVGGWHLRGGLAFGPVISGVIGRERYGFDLWGHTVNLAARLADASKAGELTLDRQAAEALGKVASAVPAGTQMLKGIGPTEVFRFASPQAAATPYPSRD